MVNLIAEKSQRLLTSRYYAHFFVVCSFLVGAAFLSGAVLILPSYLYAQSEADTANRFLEASQKAMNAGAAGGAPGILALLAERVGIMKTYTHEPATARILSAMTTEPTAGITLTKISFEPGEKTNGKITITGQAATRESLLAFVQKLQNKNLFSGVALPVSDLASGSKIPFTLSFAYDLSAL